MRDCMRCIEVLDVWIPRSNPSQDVPSSSSSSSSSHPHHHHHHHHHHCQTTDLWRGWHAAPGLARWRCPKSYQGPSWTSLDPFCRRKPTLARHARLPSLPSAMVDFATYCRIKGEKGWKRRKCQLRSLEMKACLICRVAVGLSVRWLLKEWLASLDKNPTELLANLHAQSGVRRLGGWVGIQHVSAIFLTCEHEHCDFMLLVALCWSNFGVLWKFRRFSHITYYYFMWCILIYLDISWCYGTVVRLLCSGIDSVLARTWPRVRHEALPQRCST